MADAQFGVQTVLRPYVGFESVYATGVSGSTPIPFVEAGEGPTDPEAGKPGYSPRLLRGIPVAFGSRIQIALPSILNTEDSGYTWQIVWRLRGPGDGMRSDGRLGWHFPKTANGQPEAVGGMPTDRILIPALYETILYTSAEPAGDGRASSNLRIAVTSPKSDVVPLPLLPGGVTGYYQQGVIDPGGTFPWSGLGPYPSYSSYFTNAKGDEMILVLYRDSVTDWDFATTDALVYSMFGPNSPSGIGVYVCQGTSP